MTHAVVLGAYGSAGVAAAEGLADAPEIDRLTLVDDGDPGGGLCILRGCMPSKEVLSAAAHRYRVRHDDRLVGDPPGIDLDRVVDRKDDNVLGYAEHRRAAVQDLADREGVEFLHAPARFVDDHTVDVDGRRIEADYVVVATGSTLNVPDIEGIEDVDYLASRDVLDARSLPDSGVVIGFGYVGVELVPYLAEAGVDLTVIEHDERPLDRAHRDIGDELLALYREEFDVDVVTESRETRLESRPDGVRVHLDGDGPAHVDGERLFLFTGRRPNLDRLALGETRLDPGEGWVQGTMQARDDDRTYVVGDAVGDRMILHVAKEEGAVAARNVRASERGDTLEIYDPIPHFVMFAGAAVYPYASVGLTAEEARAAGHDPVTVQRAASDDGVFAAKDASRGLARLVVARDGTVLGYHGLHLHADAMAKTMQVVVERGMDVHGIPDRAYHPTTPEIIDGLLRAASEQV